MMNKLTNYTRRKRNKNHKLYQECLEKLIEEEFPEHSEKNKEFMFYLGSLFYHKDVIKQIEKFRPKGFTRWEALKEAVFVYDAFYHYSDTRFKEAMKIEPLRIIFKSYCDKYGNTSKKNDE